MGTAADFYQQGGVVMHYITLVALVAGAIALERLVVLSFARATDVRRFWSQIQKFVISNDLDRAVALCTRTERAALARVIRAGLRNATYGPDRIDAATREAVAEVTPGLTRRIRIVSSLANIACLLGLLGTVFGMVTGFRHAATVSLASRQGALLKEVSIVLHTSAYGIAVAVGLWTVVLVLRSRSQHLCAELELYAARLRALLCAYVEARTPLPGDPFR